MGQCRPLFVYFRSFHIRIQLTNIQFELYKLKRSIDGVLGTRTRGGRMEGPDESTELWQHPQCANHASPATFFTLAVLLCVSCTIKLRRLLSIYHLLTVIC